MKRGNVAGRNYAKNLTKLIDWDRLLFVKGIQRTKKGRFEGNGRYVKMLSCATNRKEMGKQKMANPQTVGAQGIRMT